MLDILQEDRIGTLTVTWYNKVFIGCNCLTIEVAASSPPNSKVAIDIAIDTYEEGVQFPNSQS